MRPTREEHLSGPPHRADGAPNAERVPGIEHVALWTLDLERLAVFYETWFTARRGEPYHNPRSGLRSLFLSWPWAATRLELMTRPDVEGTSGAAPRPGYAHVAISVGSARQLDEYARRMAAAGIPLLDGPRWTGDGYYEAVVLDPDGNRVELTASTPAPTTTPGLPSPHRTEP